MIFFHTQNFYNRRGTVYVQIIKDIHPHSVCVCDVVVSRFSGRVVCAWCVCVCVCVRVCVSVCVRACVCVCVCECFCVCVGQREKLRTNSVSCLCVCDYVCIMCVCLCLCIGVSHNVSGVCVLCPCLCVFQGTLWSCLEFLQTASENCVILSWILADTDRSCPVWWPSPVTFCLTMYKWLTRDVSPSPDLL